MASLIVATAGLTHVATWQGFSPAQRRVFAAHFWQKQPLVVRGLLSADELREFCAITPEDLLDLSCEPDAASRLVRESGGASPWEVAHGPLDAGGLSALAGDSLRSSGVAEPGGSLDDAGGSLWTVLVNQVDRAIPEVEALRDFVADFVPRWRVDDVMVSYAKTGCSIGAHVDNYDVFLLQVLAPASTAAQIPRRLPAPSISCPNPHLLTR
jgi:50S ribosomal protein L16 3-hydroxylase